MIDLTRFKSVAITAARCLHHSRAPPVNIDRKVRVDAADEGLEQGHDACGLGVSDARKLRLDSADEVSRLKALVEGDLEVAEGEVQACARGVDCGAQRDGAQAVLAEGEPEPEVLDLREGEVAEVDHAEDHLDERAVDGETDVVLGDVDGEIDADGAAATCGFGAVLGGAVLGGVAFGGVALCCGDRGAAGGFVIDLTDVRAQQARDALELDLAESEAARVDVDGVAERFQRAVIHRLAHGVDAARRLGREPGGAEIVDLEHGGVRAFVGEGRAELDRETQVAEQDAADAVGDEGAEVEVRLKLDAYVDLALREGRLDHRGAVKLSFGKLFFDEVILRINIALEGAVRGLHQGADELVGAFCFILGVDGPAILVVFRVGNVIRRHEEAVGAEQVREQADSPARERVVIAIFAGLEVLGGHGEARVRAQGDGEVGVELARGNVEELLIFIRTRHRTALRVDALGADVEVLHVHGDAERLGHLDGEGEQVALVSVAVGLDADVAEVGKLHVNGEVGAVRTHLGEDGLHRGERELQREVAGVDGRGDVSVVVQRHAVGVVDGSRGGFCRRLRKPRARKRREQRVFEPQPRDLALHALAQHAGEIRIQGVVLKDDGEDGGMGRNTVVDDRKMVVDDVQLDLQRAVEGEVGVEVNGVIRFLLVADVAAHGDAEVGADKLRAAQQRLERLDAEDEVRKFAEVDARARLAPEADVQRGLQTDAELGDVFEVTLIERLSIFTDEFHRFVGRREGLVERKAQVVELDGDIDVAEQDVLARDLVFVEVVGVAGVIRPCQFLDAADEHVDAVIADVILALRVRFGHLTARDALIIVIGGAGHLAVKSGPVLFELERTRVRITFHLRDDGVSVRVEGGQLIAVAQPHLFG